MLSVEQEDARLVKSLSLEKSQPPFVAQVQHSLAEEAVTWVSHALSSLHAEHWREPPGVVSAKPFQLQSPRDGTKSVMRTRNSALLPIHPFILGLA